MHKQVKVTDSFICSTGSIESKNMWLHFANLIIIPDRTIKKKKDQIMRYVKLGIIVAIIKYKISLFIKLFMAAVLTKIFFLVLSNLLLNTVRLFIDLKKSSEPQKNIYYEHSQHDHHYDGEPWHEEEGFWGRWRFLNLRFVNFENPNVYIVYF